MHVKYCWNFNPLGAETRIFQDNYVDTIAADTLALCISRPSAAMVLIMQSQSFAKKDFNYLQDCVSGEMIESANISWCSLK